ncbi:MAG TPA: DUF1330 domain-containing protein [Cellvibrio sp.]|nr:DUF1330 domain-containing protein [Cellvibrio sp.]
MKAMAIIETNVIDPSWIEDYSKNVTPMLLRCGGKYLTMTSNVELLEGFDKPQFSVVVEFPSREVALEFYNSEEYAPYKRSRLAGSICKFLLVSVENGAS